MFSEFENLEKIEVLREDGMVDYYPHFLDLDQSTALFQKISSSEKFEQNDILLFGKRVKVPRLEAYYALNGEAYGYSGQALTVQLFPSYLNELRLQVQEKTKSQFNALLINYYRDGQDSNGWHADNEKSLGEEPNIASLSLGAVRRFELKHMANGIKKKYPFGQREPIAHARATSKALQASATENKRFAASTLEFNLSLGPAICLKSVTLKK